MLAYPNMIKNGRIGEQNKERQKHDLKKKGKKKGDMLACPSMMLSVTPLRLSASAKTAASIKISTVSSKDDRSMGPLSTLLMPCRVMAIRWPRNVITSIRVLR